MPRKKPNAIAAPAKPRGRKPAGKPPHPSVNTTVPPEVFEWLRTIGDDGTTRSASRGARLAILAAYAARTSAPLIDP